MTKTKKLFALIFLKMECIFLSLIKYKKSRRNINLFLFVLDSSVIFFFWCIMRPFSGNFTIKILFVILGFKYKHREVRYAH